MHIPVVSPDKVIADQPKHLVVLAWNFFDEIANQLSAYSKAGGRFVLPVPQPQIR